FTLSSGAFSQGTQTMNVAGNFALANGTTFTKATGGQALTLDGTGTLSDSNGTLQDLGALTIAGPTSTRTLTSAIKLTAFTQTDGTFTAGNHALTTGGFTLSGGTFNAPSNTLTVSGDWTHTGGGTFNHNSGTVV